MGVGIAYTVGVRRLLPWFKRFKVTSHEATPAGLWLSLETGARLYVAGWTVRAWKVYPDYSIAQQKIERLKAELHQQTPPPASPVQGDGDDGEDFFAAELERQRASQQE